MRPTRIVVEVDRLVTDDATLPRDFPAALGRELTQLANAGAAAPGSASDGGAVRAIAHQIHASVQRMSDERSRP